MESKGVMQEIREHLALGRSTAEVIAMGYKAPTVYKVQRWMRRSRRPRQPKDRDYAPQGSYPGESGDGSLESLCRQFVAVWDAVLLLAAGVGGYGMGCPACGEYEGKWEYYEVDNPGKAYKIQGVRCSRCHWAADMSELEPTVRHQVDFASSPH